MRHRDTSQKGDARLELNYTDQGRRPSATQIVSDWKKAGAPPDFTVEYGETYAHFNHSHFFGPPQWNTDGNGCRGIQRDKVLELLNRQ